MGENIDIDVIKLCKEGLKLPEIRAQIASNYSGTGETIPGIIKRLIKEGKITQDEIKQAIKSRQQRENREKIEQKNKSEQQELEEILLEYKKQELEKENREIKIEEQKQELEELKLERIKQKLLRKRLIEDRIDEIVELYRKAMSQTEIRNCIIIQGKPITQTEIGELLRRLRKEGIITRKIESERLKIEEGELRNKTPEEKQEIITKINNRLTQEQINYIVELYKKGISLADIADRIVIKGRVLSINQLSFIIKQMKEVNIITLKIELDRRQVLDKRREETQEFKKQFNKYENMLSKEQMKKTDLIGLSKIVIDRQENINIWDAWFVAKAYVKLGEFDEGINFLQGTYKYFGEINKKRIIEYIRKILEIKQEYIEKINTNKYLDVRQSPQGTDR